MLSLVSRKSSEAIISSVLRMHGIESFQRALVFKETRKVGAMYSSGVSLK